MILRVWRTNIRIALVFRNLRVRRPLWRCAHSRIGGDLVVGIERGLAKTFHPLVQRLRHRLRRFRRFQRLGTSRRRLLLGQEFVHAQSRIVVVRRFRLGLRKNAACPRSGGLVAGRIGQHVVARHDAWIYHRRLRFLRRFRWIRRLRGLRHRLLRRQDSTKDRFTKGVEPFDERLRLLGFFLCVRPVRGVHVILCERLARDRENSDDRGYQKWLSYQHG